MQHALQAKVVHVDFNNLFDLRLADSVLRHHIILSEECFVREVNLSLSRSQVVAKPHAEQEGAESKRAKGNLEASPLLLSEIGVHLECLSSDTVLFIHHFSELEVKTGYLIVSKVRSQSNIDCETAVRCIPLGVMVNRLGFDANSFHKSSGLFKRGELERLL